MSRGERCVPYSAGHRAPDSCAAAPGYAAGRGRGPAADSSLAVAGRLLESYGRTRNSRFFAGVCRMIRPWLSASVRAAACSRRIDPDEVVCNVLADLFLSRKGFRFQGERSFRSWMRVVARNAVLKEMRAGLAPRRSLESVAEAGDGGLNDPARRLAAREEAESIAGAYALLAALCCLKIRNSAEVERDAIFLHYGQGVPIHELAGLLGMSRQKAAGLLRRARERVIRGLVQVLCTRAGTR